MTTFYAVPALEELPRIRDEGLNEYTLYDDYENALEHAWDGETVVVSVEVDDPDKAIFIDDEATDRLYANLSDLSRTLRPGEEAPLPLVDFRGEPITWDDPWALDRAKDLYKYITERGDVPEPTWRDSFEDFGTAILEERVPPDRIMLMTPVDLSEIESKAEYRQAVEEMQPVALSSLGAAFWVWLILYMSQLFGPEWGQQAEAEEAERKAKKRRARKKKSKKKRKPRKRKRKGASMGANPWIRRRDTRHGEMFYVFVPAEDGVELWIQPPGARWRKVDTVADENRAEDLVDQIVRDVA